MPDLAVPDFVAPDPDGTHQPLPVIARWMRPAEPARRRRAEPDRVLLLCALASCLLHLGAAGVLTLARAPLVTVTPEAGINVDIVTAGQLEAMEHPPAVPAIPPPAADLAAPAAAPSPPPAPAPSSAAVGSSAPNPDDSGMVRATRLFSTSILADPRSRKVRRALSELAGDERMVQLCDIEALQQVHQWKSGLQPDVLVPYALSDIRQSADSMEADGGAFRSGRRWFNISFRCRLTSDRKQVAAFEFRVGPEIPRREWKRHDLGLDDGPED